MKFKFIGINSILYDFSNNETYQILQFGMERYGSQKKYLVIYVIDDKKKLNVIPYSSTDTFNENWEFIE